MNADTPSRVEPKARWQQLPIFFALCFAALAFGGLFQPGQWYQDLVVPPWTPPNIAFPIAWSILYALIAIAGWLIFASGNKTLQALWLAQLLLNGLWSWIFFGLHDLLLALIDIMAIDLLVINLILKARRAEQQVAAILLCPYLAWLLLATSLNAYIYLAN